MGLDEMTINCQTIFVSVKCFDYKPSNNICKCEMFCILHSFSTNRNPYIENNIVSSLLFVYLVRQVRHLLNIT